MQFRLHYDTRLFEKDAFIISLTGHIYQSANLEVLRFLPISNLALPHQLFPR